MNNYSTLGLSKLDHAATISQNYATSDYRYTGVTPNNYITFNNEIWRIVGVFEVENAEGSKEKRVKIIRDELIGEYSWDTSESGINNGYGINSWNQADLMTLLNSGAYYNRTSGTCYNGPNNRTTACDFGTNGLTSDAKNLISDTKWYTGGSPTDNYKMTAEEHYSSERGTNLKGCSSGTDCNDTVTRETTWTGKIGLIYLSDYGYAATSDCYNTNIYDYDSSCKNKNWLFNSAYQWSFSPYVDSAMSYRVLFVNPSGYIYVDRASSTPGVRPVTYLKSEVMLTSGTGTRANPYQITL